MFNDLCVCNCNRLAKIGDDAKIMGDGITGSSFSFDLIISSTCLNHCVSAGGFVATAAADCASHSDNDTLLHAS